MIDAYLLLKWVHILSATVLFGTGLGTAFYFWMAHRSGDPKLIAAVGRHVVLGDWLFTGTSGVMQLASGLALVHVAGYSFDDSWLIAAYALFALAFACWAPVVWLQKEAARLAADAAARSLPLPPRYRQIMRLWFVLGWPAFVGLVAMVGLMIVKPALW